MNNHTTPETSARLKSAGFPQPAPEFGQIWYGKNPVYSNEKDTLVIVGADHGELYDGGRINVIFSGGTCEDFSLASFKKRFVYCPTATDILRELGVGFAIWFTSATDGNWTTHSYFDITENGECMELHTNPAEAAALAWLSLNEKK